MLLHRAVLVKPAAVAVAPHQGKFQSRPRTLVPALLLRTLPDMQS
jgi:hypothetical protein